ncbi:hypothetical protein [Streptosporangium sp. NPDC002524]|uniref:hypothetical protein n=1 Tax=Streptosporangium sp. NPDC002524 TaxID=3154537 RepID=UPI00332AEF87
MKNGRRAPNTIDTHLSAIDDFYVRHVQLTASPRDTALALLPYFTGPRIAEVVGLDTWPTSGCRPVTANYASASSATALWTPPAGALPTEADKAAAPDALITDH